MQAVYLLKFWYQAELNWSLGVGLYMNPILVIGATGNVGSQVISQLSATGAQVRALVRNPDGAGLPAQENTVSIPCKHPSSESGSVRSPRTTF
jgi:hypothetical protein